MLRTEFDQLNILGILVKPTYIYANLPKSILIPKLFIYTLKQHTVKDHGLCAKYFNQTPIYIYKVICIVIRHKSIIDSVEILNYELRINPVNY